jgi:hypothetical protein
VSASLPPAGAAHNLRGGDLGEVDGSPSSLESTAIEQNVGWPGWRLVRWGLAGCYFTAFIVSAQTVGVPFDRERLLIWLVIGLMIPCVGRTWWDVGQVIADWIPFIAFLVLYDFSRGVADGMGMPTAVEPQLRAEEWLFGWMTGGDIPTVWLQDRLHDMCRSPRSTRCNVRWYDGPTALVYVSHFILPFATAAVLYAKRRQLWRRYVTRLLTVSFSGVLIFMLIPTAPPWFAARDGLLPRVDRIPTKGWSLLHIDSAETLIQRAWDSGNTVAAIPSLHCAYAFVIAMFFWPKVTRWWLRPLLLIHPLWMVFTVTYGGEHYVVDAIAGWLLVWFSFWLWRRLDRRYPPSVVGVLQRVGQRRREASPDRTLASFDS